MTPQQIYNKVRDHLLQQNQRSVSGQSCRYRQGELKCAVGCLIDDEAYTPDLESNAVERPVVQLALAASGVPYTPLLTDLQLVHDDCHPAVWAAELTRVAKQHGLTP